MVWYNYLVVGTGPSGISAARRLAGQGVCVVDAGEVPKAEFSYRSLSEALGAGDREALLGPRFEMLANLADSANTHAKLRAPAVNHVARGEPFSVIGAAGEVLLHGAGSYAAGGMSNAWGAQMLRYTREDFDAAGGWPFGVDTLSPYYDDLETHIGISGASDDMADFLGPCAQMLEPSPIVPAASYLLGRYEKKAKRRKAGLQLGRARLAVLTKALRNRGAHRFGETEFFSTTQEGIYTASRTLDDLLSTEKIDYLPKLCLETYSENADYVEVKLRNRDSGEMVTKRTKHLLIGCGVIHTARIILNSENGHLSHLPFIDHPPTLLPLFLPRMFGSALPDRSFPVQLVGTLGHDRDMISFYYPGALLWSDLLPDVPLPIGASTRLLRNLLGGMLVAQIWETSRPSPDNFLCFGESGHISIRYGDSHPYSRMRKLISALRPLGAYTLSKFASMSPPGWGFHYAGTLPMRIHPGKFETHVDGRLWNRRRVRVVDGSVLPSLPAKNHSLTLMANAARIADEAARCGY